MYELCPKGLSQEYLTIKLQRIMTLRLLKELGSNL
jgi:hypothetical protein